MRWSGSKTKLLPALENLAPTDFEAYVEPFAGSASLFFKLCPENAILGDINPAVVDVYRAIQQDANLLADTLDSIPPTRESYYTLRALNQDGLSLAQRAARLIFLMKACFNGVYRTNRIGQFNVPMGSRLYAIPTRDDLTAAAKILRGVKLISGDFTKTLSLTKPGDWIYLDPPYRQPGRYRGEYGMPFDKVAFDKLLIIAESLAKAGRFVMLSYCEDDSMLAKLKGWNVCRSSTRRTVSGNPILRRNTVELIVTSY